MGRVREGVTGLLGLPDGYEVILGNGGTTAFWDALAFSVVRERGLHLTFGEFSAKFAKVTEAAPFLADPIVLSARARLGARAGGRPGRRRGGLGPQRDLHRGHGRGERPAGDALVLIDATSGAGGLPLDAAAADSTTSPPRSRSRRTVGCGWPR